jgi:hypothetical protein
MTDLDTAPYELLSSSAGAREAALYRIGRYPAYDEALRARDEDVLDKLAARGGWYTVVEHVIIGPGLQGPRTVHGTQARSGWTRRQGGSQVPTTSTTHDTG